MEQTGTTNIINPNTADHDLLIELKTDMKNVGKVLQEVRGDIREIKDNTQTRIERLAQEKLDKEEAEARMGELEKTKVDKSDFITSHSDHEARLRKLETWGWMAIGAIALLNSGLFIYLIRLVN